MNCAKYGNSIELNFIPTNLDKLIELTDKKAALLREYKEALIYEKCLYHVIEQKDRKGWFFLILIASGAIVREGTPQRITRYIETRKIDRSKVYNIQTL